MNHDKAVACAYIDGTVKGARAARLFAAGQVAANTLETQSVDTLLNSMLSGSDDGDPRPGVGATRRGRLRPQQRLHEVSSSPWSAVAEASHMTPSQRDQLLAVPEPVLDVNTDPLDTLPAPSHGDGDVHRETVMRDPNFAFLQTLVRKVLWNGLASPAVQRILQPKIAAELLFKHSSSGNWAMVLHASDYVAFVNDTITAFCVKYIPGNSM
jgi:hypothetical protein